METLLLESSSTKLGSLKLGFQSSHCHIRTDIHRHTATRVTAGKGVPQKPSRKHLSRNGTLSTSCAHLQSISDKKLTFFKIAFWLRMSLPGQFWEKQFRLFKTTKQ